jgi:hypothetical protein
MSSNSINSPDHYTIGGPEYEVFKILKNKLSKEEYQGYLKGNVLKYMFRAGHKASSPLVEDLGKANEYLRLLMEEARAA